MSIDSLLALDVGGGTRDLLIWQRDQRIENAVKMVLPSPTRVAARRLAQARAQGRPVFLHGWLMGGGAVTRAVKEHIAAGLEVRATPPAAATFYDDPARVEAMGVAIGDQPPAGAVTVPLGDLDLESLGTALGLFNVELPSSLAVAVCDHGFSPGFSNRKFRFGQWRTFLEDGGALGDLITGQPSEQLTRMRAIADQAPGVLLMDTAAAALWGALQDPTVAARADQGICVVNAGNMHTVGFLLAGRRVMGVYEHHTRCLDTARLNEHIARFIKGSLDDQEVFDDDGHGCARLAEAPRAISGPVVLTGPQRRLARGLGWQTAVPLGDVMLSGCFGLVAAARVHAGEADPRWY